MAKAPKAMVERLEAELRSFVERPIVIKSITIEEPGAARAARVTLHVAKLDSAPEVHATGFGPSIGAALEGATSILVSLWT